MRKASKNSPPVDMRRFEEQTYRRGFQRIAGIDEVGRGPLAGPVVAAAVILPPDADLPEVRDSKELSAQAREALSRQIRQCALDFGIALVDAEDIDRLNILQATFLAMKMAVSNLKSPPDFLLIDGPYTLDVPIAQQGIPKGDSLSLSIAAASIVAKVHRDHLMCEYHTRYPHYAFDSNKGYGTTRHLKALEEHGPCCIHRKSFKRVCP